MTQILNPDSYGRTIEFSSDGVHDTYIVKDLSGTETIRIKFPKGKDPLKAYETINSMAPSDQAPPQDIPIQEQLQNEIEELKSQIDVLNNKAGIPIDAVPLTP